MRVLLSEYVNRPEYRTNQNSLTGVYQDEGRGNQREGDGGMNAKEILHLIENADINDRDDLNYIDAQAGFYVKHSGVMQDLLEYYLKDGKTYDDAVTHAIKFKYAPEYTRSRDALKAIRPKGKISWVFFNDYPEGSRARAEIFHDNGDNPIQTDWMPTEELAELHAIIRAIEFERTQ